MKQQSTWSARAACDQCGIVRIQGDEVTLRVAEHDGTAEVRFACPGCGRIQLEPVDESQTTALFRADVAIEWWHLPAELTEPHPHSPLDIADVDRFVDFLYDDIALRLAAPGLERSREPEAGRA
jgi:hypothetical protein